MRSTAPTSTHGDGAAPVSGLGALTAPARRDRVDHVPGDHRLAAPRFARPPPPRPASAPAPPRSAGERVHARARSAPRSSREDVAGPGGGQRRAAAAVDRHALAVGDDRVVALQHHDRPARLGRLARAREPLRLHLLGIGLEQAAELALVRGQDRGPRARAARRGAPRER